MSKRKDRLTGGSVGRRRRENFAYLPPIIIPIGHVVNLSAADRPRAMSRPPGKEGGHD
jgi:hypothetical protein